MKRTSLLILALKITLSLSNTASVSKVESYEDLTVKISELNLTEGDTFVIFFAPWCSDCVLAEPLLTKCIAEAPRDNKYLYVDIGDFTSWRDRNNKFRRDRDIRLERLPTLIKWGTNERLVEGELMEENLIRKMLRH